MVAGELQFAFRNNRIQQEKGDERRNIYIYGTVPDLPLSV